MFYPVTMVGSGLMPLRNTATLMPASTLGDVRQWFCSTNCTNLFICCSIWEAYSNIKSSMTQVTLVVQVYGNKILVS